MYEVPSLRKTAYHACNAVERAKYDSMETPDVDLRRCCEALFAVLKADRDVNENDDMETMHSRSKFPIGDLRFAKICEFAASYGHIDCLRLARAIGVPWDSFNNFAAHPDIRCNPLAFGSACEAAAKSGSLECLRYARENGSPIGERTCTYAALNGRLDILIYARENGCPWDKWTSIVAKLFGHMDCLDYALKNGCPWDERTYNGFAFAKELFISGFLVDNY